MLDVDWGGIVQMANGQRWNIYVIHTTPRRWTLWVDDSLRTSSLFCVPCTLSTVVSIHWFWDFHETRLYSPETHALHNECSYTCSSKVTHVVESRAIATPMAQVEATGVTWPVHWFQGVMWLLWTGGSISRSVIAALHVDHKPAWMVLLRICTVQ